MMGLYVFFGAAGMLVWMLLGLGTQHLLRRAKDPMGDARFVLVTWPIELVVAAIEGVSRNPVGRNAIAVPPPAPAVPPHAPPASER